MLGNFFLAKFTLNFLEKVTLTFTTNVKVSLIICKKKYNGVYAKTVSDIFAFYLLF